MSVNDKGLRSALEDLLAASEDFLGAAERYPENVSFFACDFIAEAEVKLVDAQRWTSGCPAVRGMPIPGFAGYCVTEMGSVISSRTNAGKVGSVFRVRRTTLDGNGYPSITLIADCRRLRRRVHRLVAEAFIANPLGLPCVRHMDGDKENCAASNLAWGTYADNEDDKRRHGTWGLRVGGAKLSADDREKIMTLHAAGMDFNSIATKFAVHRDTVRRLVSGKTWAWSA